MNKTDKSPFLTLWFLEITVQFSLMFTSKPTHTNRYLDYNSHHDYKHRISTATTLINRSLTLSTHYPLVMNVYSQKLISNLIVKHKIKTITRSPEELVRTFFESIERMPQHNSYAVLPYIKGITEPLQRTLSKFDIKVFTNQTCENPAA